MSLKSDILAAVACPEGESSLGGMTIRIRGMNAQEEVRYLPPASGEQANGVAICAACIVDAKGEPLFTEAEISALKAGTLGPVLKDILDLSFPDTGTEAKNF